MKTKIILFTCLLFISGTLQSQTKQETITWLNSKLGSSPFIQNNGMTYTKILNIKQDGSFTVIQDDEYAITSSLNSTSKFSGHFKNLSPTTIKINPVEGYYFIVATCSSGKCISQVSTYRDGVDKFITNDVVLGIVDDSEMAQRVRKAVAHLINLNKGKKEVF